MNILIQGRKDGYNVLFPNPTPKEFYSFASDIQSISAKNDALYYGKNFYSLAFASEGFIFTKYVIGYDIQRSNLGNIGISVIIPNAQTLSGNNVKSLLDELLNTYCINYCPDNNIGAQREDWPLFTSLADSYDAKLVLRSSNDNLVTPGTLEPAFHYYKSDNELIEYLDKPFQEEYIDYRQILFIDSNLKGAGNPLNVLKNSGKEVNPDLKNEYYYLNNYNSTKKVKIVADSKPRSDGKGNHQIRAKWQVEIKYSKDDRCYEPINATGKLSDTSSEIYNYLETKGSQILIKYDAFNNPIEKVKPVTFEIKDRNGNDISDAEITCKNNNYQLEKTVTNNQIVFSGEELKENWKVIVRKGDFSGKTEFTPEKTNESVKIIVEKRNIIAINVKDEGGKKLIGFEVWTKLTNGYQTLNTLEFVDEQIVDSYQITLRMNGYKDEVVNNFQPNKQNSIDVILKKKQETIQIPSKDGSHKHEPEKPKPFTTKAKIFFSKPAFIASLVVGMLILSFGIWALCHFFGNDKQHPETKLIDQQITDYVEGDSLRLDKLEGFKKEWKSQEANFIKKSSTGLLGGGEEKVDSTVWKSSWNSVNKSIEKAIDIRKMIEKKDFKNLQHQQYFNKQENFKKAITTLIKSDSAKYDEVSSKLGNISAQTLTEIAVKIKEILKSQESITEEGSKKDGKKMEQTEEKSPKINTPLNPSKKHDVSPTGGKITHIIEYIKRDDLKQDTLKQFLKDIDGNENLKRSINLVLKLWSLDGTSNNSYSSYIKELSKDTNLKDSKLKKFIEEMNKKTSPKYVKDLPASDQKKSLSDTKSKML